MQSVSSTTRNISHWNGKVSIRRLTSTKYAGPTDATDTFPRMNGGLDNGPLLRQLRLCKIGDVERGMYHLRNLIRSKWAIEFRLYIWAGLSAVTNIFGSVDEKSENCQFETTNLLISAHYWDIRYRATINRLSACIMQLATRKHWKRRFRSLHCPWTALLQRNPANIQQSYTARNYSPWATLPLLVLSSIFIQTDVICSEIHVYRRYIHNVKP